MSQGQPNVFPRESYPYSSNHGNSCSNGYYEHPMNQAQSAGVVPTPQSQPIRPGYVQAALPVQQQGAMSALSSQPLSSHYQVQQNQVQQRLPQSQPQLQQQRQGVQPQPPQSQPQSQRQDGIVPGNSSMQPGRGQLMGNGQLVSFASNSNGDFAGQDNESSQEKPLFAVINEVLNDMPGISGNVNTFSARPTKPFAGGEHTRQQRKHSTLKEGLKGKIKTYWWFGQLKDHLQYKFSPLPQVNEWERRLIPELPRNVEYILARRRRLEALENALDQSFARKLIQPDIRDFSLNDANFNHLLQGQNAEQIQEQLSLKSRQLSAALPLANLENQNQSSNHNPFASGDNLSSTAVGGYHKMPDVVVRNNDGGMRLSGRVQAEPQRIGHVVSAFDLLLKKIGELSGIDVDKVEVNPYEIYDMRRRETQEVAQEIAQRKRSYYQQYLGNIKDASGVDPDITFERLECDDKNRDTFIMSYYFIGTILGCYNRQMLVICGEPGSGKSSCCHALANKYMLLRDRLPECFKPVSRRKDLPYVILVSLQELRDSRIFKIDESAADKEQRDARFNNFCNVDLLIIDGICNSDWGESNIPGEVRAIDSSSQRILNEVLRYRSANNLPMVLSITGQFASVHNLLGSVCYESLKLFNCCVITSWGDSRRNEPLQVNS